MNSQQYETLVAEYFREKGYDVQQTPYSNDYGVDCFASKGKERIAVQAKMFGNSTRKINRRMVMELHGAKDYFDCTKASLVTDGVLLDDAVEVAAKLRIEVIYLSAKHLDLKPQKPAGETFAVIWEKYILPLQGITLTRANGKTNKIITADWSGIERLTSNGKQGKINIEIFEFAVNKLLKSGLITRDEINQNCSERVSSGVVLILSQVPFFQQTAKPTGLTYRT
ncbi:MAG: restriction endonuclease [Actinobacteria bacterium]|nr:restriction endonuclease [Actinomycetota bacterium]